eukprot:SM000042S15301  [mRNA]  locus=s42:191846:203002:+ [translate_table: standard]
MALSQAIKRSASAAALQPADAADRHLCDDVLLDVLARLDAKDDRDACSCVSKQWLEVEGRTRRVLSLGAVHDAAPACISRAMLRFPSLHTLDIGAGDGLWFGQRIAAEDLVHSLQNASCRETLRTLKLGTAGIRELHDDGLVMVVGLFSKLQDLQLRNFPKVTGDGMKQVLLKCNMLTRLSLLQDTWDDMDMELLAEEPFKQLQDLRLAGNPRITSAGFVHISVLKNTIRSLSIEESYTVDDEAIHSIVDGGCAVENVNLSKCFQITDVAVSSLATYCEKLWKLTITGCGRLTDASLNVLAEKCSDKLRELDLTAFNFTDAGIAAVGKCTKLERLAVKIARRPARITTFAPLGACCMLQEALLDELDVVGADAITKGCPLLRTLSACASPASPKLTSPRWHFSRPCWVKTTEIATGAAALPHGGADGAIAGATAGVTVETALYPLDTIKTRLQAVRTGSAINLRGLYSGLSGNLAGVLPASAIFVGVYEPLKQKLLRIFPEHLSVAAHLTAGAAGGLAASLVRVPTEVVKQRMQTGQFSAATQAFKQILSKEGTRGLYAGYSSFLLRDLPFDALQFAVYEQLKIGYGNTVKRELKSPEMAAMGALSGAITGAVTTPLDVIKTRLMTQGAAGHYKGVADCVRKIVAEEGSAALLKGLGPRVTWIGIGGSIFFAVLEKTKELLKQQQEAQLHPQP